jgi:hypothetical protein
MAQACRNELGPEMSHVRNLPPAGTARQELCFWGVRKGENLGWLIPELLYTSQLRPKPLATRPDPV